MKKEGVEFIKPLLFFQPYWVCAPCANSNPDLLMKVLNQRQQIKEVNANRSESIQRFVRLDERARKAIKLLKGEFENEFL